MFWGSHPTPPFLVYRTSPPEARMIWRFLAWLTWPRWLWHGPYWLRSLNAWWLAHYGRIFYDRVK
jgi:hypothetical protein